MKMSAVLCLVLLSTFAQADDGRMYSCNFVKVTDGDTVKVKCPQFPEMFRDLSVRVMGIDTPESRMPPAKCEKEARLGLIAKGYFTQQFDGATKVTFRWAGEKDKYGGRVLGSVLLPNGKDWAESAIKRDLARPYGLDGSLTKSDWCK
jgi:endonuclease YncB( thermonuclease family)